MLDRVLSVLAVAQAILVTLQAGSKVWTGLVADHNHNSTNEGQPDLPLILPPPESERSALLLDLARAFRHGVELGLHHGVRATTATTTTTTTTDVYTVVIDEDAGVRPLEPYRMSLVPVRPSEQPSGVEAPVDPEDDALVAREEEDAPTPLHGNPAFITPRQRRRLLIPQKRSKEEARLDFDESWVTEYALASNQTAVVSAYSPRCFASLRSYYGLDDRAYRKAVLDSGPFFSFQSNSKGAARTGGIFFLTRGGSYLVKTIKRDELRTLRHMLPRYVDHMRDNGQRSLLNRVCGLYQVSLNGGKDLYYFVVMNSVFAGGARIAERFDLKGSTVGRQASLEDRETLGSHAVLKDLDLALEVQQAVREIYPGDGEGHHRYGLHIGPVAKAALLAQLRSDVALLQRCSVIDYSLLVGVATSPGGESRRAWSARRRAAGRSLLGVRHHRVHAGRLAVLPGERRGQPATFYFGLIDFLQPFDYKKDVEYRLKGLVYKKDAYSCVPPSVYARRFLDFVDKHVT